MIYFLSKKEYEITFVAFTKHIRYVFESVNLKRVNILDCFLNKQSSEAHIKQRIFFLFSSLSNIKNTLFFYFLSR